jgi:transformation/transcription domain-associated protein
MIQALTIKAKPGNAPLLRTRYSEFVACQVKTLSFLTYLLRGFQDMMRQHEDRISRSVIDLLKNCPGDAVTTRKELLVATRHILATDFRKGFYAYVKVT